MQMLDSYLKITDARHRVPDSQTLAVKLACVCVTQKKISVLLFKPCHETYTNIGYRLQTDIVQNMLRTFSCGFGVCEIFLIPAKKNF